MSHDGESSASPENFDITIGDFVAPSRQTRRDFGRVFSELPWDDDIEQQSNVQCVVHVPAMTCAVTLARRFTPVFNSDTDVYEILDAVPPVAVNWSLVTASATYRQSQLVGSGDADNQATIQQFIELVSQEQPNSREQLWVKSVSELILLLRRESNANYLELAEKLLQSSPSDVIESQWIHHEFKNGSYVTAFRARLATGGVRLHLADQRATYREQLVHVALPDGSSVAYAHDTKESLKLTPASEITRTHANLEDQAIMQRLTDAKLRYLTNVMMQAIESGVTASPY